MNRTLTTSIFAALAFLTGLNGCVGECYDCGPCGFIGGPNTEDALRVGHFGVDSKDVPTFGLITWQNGGCAGEPSTSVWVQYEAGKITSKPAPSGELLDGSTVVAMSSTYTWNGKDITATTEKVTELSLRISFTEAGMTKSVICTSTGGAATCVDEVP